MLSHSQTLYIYLGTAGLIGCMTGAVDFVLFKFVSSSLNLDPATLARPRDRNRTTADFRVEQREKKKRVKKVSTPRLVPASVPDPSVKASQAVPKARRKMTTKRPPQPVAAANDMRSRLRPRNVVNYKY